MTTLDASSEGAETVPPGRDEHADVPEYRLIAVRVEILETNAAQVLNGLADIQRGYAEDVAANWRAGHLSPAEAVEAYRLGRRIGAEFITGWSERWADAGMPSIHRLYAMARRLRDAR